MNFLSKRFGFDYLKYKNCLMMKIISIIFIYYEPIHQVLVILSTSSIFCKEEYVLNNSDSGGSAFSSFDTSNANTNNSSHSKSMGNFVNVSVVHKD